MSTAPKPRPSGRTRKPRKKSTPSVTTLSAADRKHIAYLVRNGLGKPGPNFGKPLPAELFEPGPADPTGAIGRALAEDRL